MRKKWLSRRGPSQKNKGKRSGGHVKYFSKTLKWHNVLEQTYKAGYKFITNFPSALK